MLNWAVIATLYVLTFFVVRNDLLVFASVPGDDVPTHVAAPWEYGVVIGVNLALLLVVWTMVGKYVKSLVDATAPPATADVVTH